MKERLIQLLDLEQLTPSKFADIIGVQRSSVSHVISERNKPSFDFIQKTLKAFPGLNAEWLILGEGSMYEQMGRGASGNLFEAPIEPVQAQIPDDIQEVPQETIQKDDSEVAFQEHSDKQITDQSRVPSEAETDEKVPEQGTDRKIVQVMVFYDDDTFRSFGPSQ